MKARTLLLAAVLLAAPFPVAASFEGQVVRGEYLFPDDMTALPNVFQPAQTTVGPGVEFVTGFGGVFDQTEVDLTASSIIVRNINGNGIAFIGPAAFNGYGFSDVGGTIPDITGVAINPATTVAGFDASRIVFDADSVRMTFEGLTIGADDILWLDVSFGPAPVPTLPHVATAMLWICLALAGVFLLRQRLASA